MSKSQYKGHIESNKAISQLLVSKGIQVKDNRIAKSDLFKVMNIIKAGYGDIEGDEPGQKDIHFDLYLRIKEHR